MYCSMKQPVSIIYTDHRPYSRPVSRPYFQCSAGPRLCRGTTMAEMPVALWLLILMCFPLIIVATSSLRFGFFWNAAREAAMQAAKCQTFQNDSVIGIS